jgi:sRNA-binding carbon storage regulator CsrA
MPLALTHTEGQALLIVCDRREIRVEVARVRGYEIRLAVTAPDDVGIWQEEAVGR